MDIIMPVAGFGTRLRPQTWSKPKPLVPVAGKPILAHVLDRVLPLDPESVVFITGYLGDQIADWYSEHYDVPVRIVEQPEMLGQCDAIVRAREVAGKDALILFPDLLFETDFSVIERSDADVITITKEVEDPSAFGVAVEKDGKVVKLVEKPQTLVSNQAVIGIYYVRNMLDLYDAINIQIEQGIKLKNEYFLADAIQIMIDQGKKVVTAPATEWRDCGNAEALLDTNRYLLETMNPDVPRLDGVTVIPPSYVDPSATVVRSVIGPFASIGANASITNSIVSNSIVDESAEIRDSILDRSVLGREAQVSGKPQVINIGDTSVLSAT